MQTKASPKAASQRPAASSRLQKNSKVFEYQIKFRSRVSPWRSHFALPRSRRLCCPGPRSLLPGLVLRCSSLSLATRTPSKTLRAAASQGSGALRKGEQGGWNRLLVAFLCAAS